MKEYMVKLKSGTMVIVESERVEIQKDNILVFYDSKKSVVAAFNSDEYSYFVKGRKFTTEIKTKPKYYSSFMQDMCTKDNIL